MTTLGPREQHPGGTLGDRVFWLSKLARVVETGRARLSFTVSRHWRGAMRRILLRAIARLGAWTTGLLVAAWAVPGVSVSASGIIFAVSFFAVAQTTLSLWILKLPHGWAPLLLGSTGLTLTFVAMGLASALTHGLIIPRIVSWVAATILVWLVTTIGAILLPEVYIR